MSTSFEKMTADYLRISVLEVDALDFLFYLQARKDAFITTLRKTDEGREYLANAWRLNQTEPDRKASRELFGNR